MPVWDEPMAASPAKFRAIVDADGRSITLQLTAGQIADCPEAETLIEAVGESDILLADTGYDSNAIRARLAEKGCWVNTPPYSNRRGSFVFSRSVYRQRNLGERFFNRIKQVRGIVAQKDRDPAIYLAAIKLVTASGWCRSF